MEVTARCYPVPGAATEAPTCCLVFTGGTSGLSSLPSMTVRQLDRPVRTWYDIDGWFRWVDCRLFQALLGAQSESEPGTLVELGCYLGKSTVVIGDYRRAGEDFVVVDLFGDTSVLADDDHATRAETDK